MDEDAVSRVVVDGAIEGHRVLDGRVLLESIYEEALSEELLARGLTVERQRPVPVVYKGQRLGADLRLDLLVERCVVVECKATTAYNSICEAQALVINFGERLVKDGIHRVVNGL
ncbi:MAG: GxxExxY protein [Nitrospirota bacterium]